MLSKVNAFKSQCFQKSTLSKVNAFKSQRFQKSTLSKVKAFKSQRFQSQRFQKSTLSKANQCLKKWRLKALKRYFLHTDSDILWYLYGKRDYRKMATSVDLLQKELGNDTHPYVFCKRKTEVRFFFGWETMNGNRRLPLQQICPSILIKAIMFLHSVKLLYNNAKLFFL